MIEVYKIYHNIGPAYVGELFKNLEQFIYQSRTVKSVKHQRFYTMTDGRDSVSYQGTKEWNILEHIGCMCALQCANK